MLILVAPASIELSINSYKKEKGLSTTSPAEILLMTRLSRILIDINPPKIYLTNSIRCANVSNATIGESLLISISRNVSIISLSI